MLRPMAAHVFKLLLDDFHAFFDAPSIHLERRFAGTARPDAATLARERALPGVDHAGQLVEHLREFNLKLPFVGLRALREDIENHLIAINDANFPFVFEVSNLNARKKMVDGDDARPGFANEFGDLHHLAGSDQRRGIVSLKHLRDGADDFAAGRGGELFEFEKTFFKLEKDVGFKTDADAHDSFFGFEEGFSRFPSLRERGRRR